MKAVIYCRVSTEEQAREGYSLQSQEVACRSFCQRAGYEAAQIFIESGVSAKNLNRPELQKLLSYCAKNRANTQAIVVYKIDRLSRNMMDYTNLMTCFAKLGILLKSVTEHIDETPVGKLTTNMIASLAQFDNDMKGERTRDGMRQAASEGRWIWHAPVGYKFSRDSNGKSLLFPDENAPFIKEAFRLYGQGTHRQIDVITQLKSQGLKRKFSKQTLNYLLRNPIYVGEIRHRWFKEPIKGLHEPLVDEPTFERVQAFLDGRKPTATARLRNHPDFPLRNFAQCPLCMKGLTGSWSTSQNGTKYGYYYCYRKGCATKPIKRTEIETQFTTLLETLKPSEAVLRLFNAILIDAWKDRKAGQLAEQKRLEGVIKEIESRKARIDELMIQKTFDEETYRDQSTKIRHELTVRRLELNELLVDTNNIETCLNYCNAFLENPAKLWANADINMKQRFQNLVFPQGITYQAGAIGTKVISPIFKLFQDKKPAISQIWLPELDSN